jgi:hypothetical protein
MICEVSGLADDDDLIDDDLIDEVLADDDLAPMVEARARDR